MKRRDTMNGKMSEKMSEKVSETMNGKMRDRIRGSLIAGAAGDALGYTIEFWTEREIFATYGKDGIGEYDMTRKGNRISDDTQMTLFTANGLLVGATRMAERGIGAAPSSYVEMAYQDWMETQRYDFEQFRKISGRGASACEELNFAKAGISWLLEVPELFARRAPGNTCLSALADGKMKTTDYIANRINNSKGCGGIMRVAPIALLYRPGESYYGDMKALDKEGAQIAAITHGHSLGYMPAAVVAHIISRCLTHANQMTLEEMVIEARDTVAEIFPGDKHLKDLKSIMNLAIRLSKNDKSDLDNIHALGEGWVAEETLGIALYCALKYRNDLSKALQVSVNHRGDSDSTGAVTGNILGALVGYDAMDSKWKKDLELHDAILEMADDLWIGGRLGDENCTSMSDWDRKYCHMRH